MAYLNDIQYTVFPNSTVRFALPSYLNQKVLVSFHSSCICSRGFFLIFLSFYLFDIFAWRAVFTSEPSTWLVQLLLVSNICSVLTLMKSSLELCVALIDIAESTEATCSRTQPSGCVGLGTHSKYTIHLFTVYQGATLEMWL